MIRWNLLDVIDAYDIMDMHIDSITISSINIQDTYCHILFTWSHMSFKKNNV
jgi:hypothetical protein